MKNTSIKYKCSTWVNALSRRQSVVLFMFSSPGSVTVTAGPVRTRGGSTSPASLCILMQAACGKLWRGTFWTCCFLFCFISWCKCFYLWKEKLKANSWLSCVTKAAFASCVWEHDVHDAANSRHKCRCLNGPQLDFLTSETWLQPDSWPACWTEIWTQCVIFRSFLVDLFCFLSGEDMSLWRNNEVLRCARQCIL